MKKTSVILFLLAVAMSTNAQVSLRTYSEQIRTLRVLTYDQIAEGVQLTPQRPFLVLADGVVDGSDAANTLHISFDEMSHEVHFYTYTVEHMNAEWTAASGLLSSEYLTGFTTQDITAYEHSLNTSRIYTHYELVFPNSEMALTKSGNYRLVIYEDGNRDNYVAEVDFCVVEPLTGIDGKVRSNTDIEFNGRYQQLDVDVLTQAIQVKDPNEVKVLVQQNNRRDNQVWLVRPTFLENNRLRYMNNKALVFEGGNEYHHFDAFSTYYAGTGIDRVFYQNGDYQAVLFANEITTGQYIHQFDSDGRFIVNAERTSYPDTEAEYMWVHWTLPAGKPWFDGAVYVGGDIFNNEMSLRNRMQYDAEAKCYWLTALVKQGGYDYQYWFVGKGSQQSAVSLQPSVSTQRVDGSYWQTENEYTVYVYWRPFGARYDRLVGLKILKSAL
ncbi:MAG: DUF5103 domain-containing protein [Paludibacteraceae bacterium]|nr:DUF5103 domain-containing protein [Paludibacteraceae bacterium]